MFAIPSHKRGQAFATRAKGKLLLSGEYVVLDGAQALAVPVQFGQSLRAEPWKEPDSLTWTSKNEDGKTWFLAQFELPDLHILNETNRKTAENLVSFLKACQTQNPEFLSGNQGYKVMTQSDFPREWGLGTSSTLLAAMAQWAGVDPYPLLFDTLGGSGYDIACAYADGPVLYRLNGRTPAVEPVEFQPDFVSNIYFVYLERKQDSREGIRHYKMAQVDKSELVYQVSQLTERMVAARQLSEFEVVIREHEQLISRTIGLGMAKDLHFSGYWGEIKSLGAWGGDFVMATSAKGEAETRAYFEALGFGTVLGWKEMVGARQRL
jgi:mevalonate kinase